MKKTIFISSTFIDLKEERRKLWELLDNYDVFVKGMEDFGARKEDPFTTCMTEVEQADIYVGIIGLRFGSEEPKSKKSYTQCEYERAIELEKDILIYIIDEANSSVTPNLIQFDKIDKLNNFKSILKERHTVDSFSNSNDLIDKLKRQFDKLLQPKSTLNIQKTTDFEVTKKLLNLFFIVPKAYSGREVKLRVKFLNKPQPVSKSICELFNFEFGKSIASQIKIISPKLEAENFKYIFFDYEYFEQFLSLDKNKEYDIFAQILFKDEKAKSLIGNFIDKTESYLQYDVHSLSPFEVVKVGEGTVILRLKEIIATE